MGGAIPIGEKNVEASDPNYVPKEGEQATQEELAGADYESGTPAAAAFPPAEALCSPSTPGAVKGPLQGAPARAVERQVREICKLSSSPKPFVFDSQGAHRRSRATTSEAQTVVVCASLLSRARTELRCWALLSRLTSSARGRNDSEHA